jgi:HNH endonuclease
MKNLTRKDRLAIWERDRGVCGFCGSGVPFEDLHIDHIVPRAHGGTDDWTNLQAAHRHCNTSARSKAAQFGSIRSDFTHVRFAIEIQPEEEAFVRRVKAAAMLQGVPLRDWVLAALREKYEHDAQ